MIDLTEHRTYRSMNLSIEDIEFLKKNHAKHVKIKDENVLEIETSSYVGFIKLPSGQTLKISPKIPIRNMLYMIAYSYDLKSLSLNYIEKRKTTQINSPIELYIMVLIDWVDVIIRKGIYKKYEQHQEVTSNPRGKILVDESMVLFGKVACQYGCITYQNVENRIIKSTLLFLIKKFNISDNGLRKRIKSILLKLSEIEPIALNKKIFDSVIFNSYNVNYKNTISLCKVLYSGMFLEDTKGDKSFSGFVVNMNVLFEKFILKVLQRLIPEEIIKPTTHNDWLEPIEGSDNNIIPEIRTDIVIKNKLVLEAKYYKSPLNKSGKLNRENLSQLISYMNAENVNGILVYPQIEESFNDQHFKVKGTTHSLKIISIPLSYELSKFNEFINQFTKKVKDSFTIPV